MYTNNEIMFPHYVISSLRHIRGDKWQQLIDQLANKPETSVEVLALMSLMIQINGCMQCETDSYRAMRGCSACAQQTLRRYSGNDDELIQKYEAELESLRQFATENPALPIILDN